MREVKDVIIIAIRGSSVATNMGVAQKSRGTATHTIKDENDVSLVKSEWYWG